MVASTRSAFSSARERRLWAWTAAVVVAIYSTLGLARTLADELRARELLDGAFVLALVLIIAAVVVQAVRSRPGVAEVGVMLGVAATYLLVVVRMALPEERTHLIEYGVVALLAHEALTERASQGRWAPRPALLAVGIAGMIGVVDELIQLALPSRVFDPVDMGFNLLAAGLAVAASVALRRVRGRRG